MFLSCLIKTGDNSSVRQFVAEKLEKKTSETISPSIRMQTAGARNLNFKYGLISYIVNYDFSLLQIPGQSPQDDKNDIPENT